MDLKNNPDLKNILKENNLLRGKFVTKLESKHDFDSDKFTYFQKFIKGKIISVQFYIFDDFINLLSICSQFQDKDNFRLQCIFQKKQQKVLKKN